MSIVRKIKQLLKPTYRSVRTWYIEKFHAFTPADLAAALREIGLAEGDTVLAHVAFNRFEGFKGGPVEVINVLKEVVGPTGTILMPTMPFDGSAMEYIKRVKVTDIARAPSAMGFVTEVFRRTPGVVRSIHPTHPVAVLGPKAEELIRDHHLAGSPCGAGTPFLRLMEVGGKILFLGADIRTMTFYHAVEEAIEAKFPVSPFTKETFELRSKAPDGTILETRNRLFDPELSKKRDVSVLHAPLRELGMLKSTQVRRLPLMLVKAADVYKVTDDMADRGKFCYPF